MTALHKYLRGAQVAEAALILRGRTLGRRVGDEEMRTSSFAPTNDLLRDRTGQSWK